LARSPSRFVCQECGAEHPKWSGRCDSCGAWNAVIEEPAPAPGSVAGSEKGHGLVLETLKRTGKVAGHRPIGIGELDRVLGGGLVPASAVLIAGDPGIGKSTLLLQACAALSKAGGCALYVSGEEALDQLRMRAARIGLADAPVRLAASTSAADIVATVEALPPAEIPALVVIDSIQTMHVGTLESAPGTVAQVRATAQSLIALAKRKAVAVVMVGHVTKDGQIAGPRVLEHMVDTVLYFEGERGYHFRILRAVKNRFGPTDEIGVFEMSDAGLAEVRNPSAMFLGRGAAGSEADVPGSEPVPGSAVFAGMEGTRPVLVEIQALVAPSPLATPRRAVVGWDAARLAMVIAVLDARCGLELTGRDVYLSVAGGLRVSEPAADLAVAAALVSALAGKAAPDRTLFFGEVGLSGEIRPVSGGGARLKEAAKLGFLSAVVPAAPERGSGRLPGTLRTTELRVLPELLPLFGLEGRRPGRAPRRGPRDRPRQTISRTWSGQREG
jgi:DNA repair protein RadA/Sms